MAFSRAAATLATPTTQTSLAAVSQGEDGEADMLRRPRPSGRYAVQVAIARGLWGRAGLVKARSGRFERSSEALGPLGCSKKEAMVFGTIGGLSAAYEKPTEVCSPWAGRPGLLIGPCFFPRPVGYPERRVSQLRPLGYSYSPQPAPLTDRVHGPRGTRSLRQRWPTSRRRCRAERNADQ
jgi:hypothetical protein